MKIGIIGATGKAGSAVFQESVTRGHDTVAIVRDQARATEVLGDQAPVLKRDAFALTAEDLAGFDVVVDAFGTSPDQAQKHVDLARHLVECAGPKQPRLVFILGAGSLVTGEDRHLFIEEIRKAPGAEAWISIPEQQLQELAYLRTIEHVKWVGASPQATFAPGRASKPMIGVDELLLAADGKSHTTTGTMAVALLDEIEQPRHHNTRFTVGDA
ncbi:NAD(P)H-binding protein [Paeniglutamicibacter sp. MACA_103]|uniref:NAD(P)H-binding protein n=1 Tax=Paeniglutamicibacter sp. MACA_103 TaxID=3377337 RepID=UPI0038965F96